MNKEIMIQVGMVIGRIRNELKNNNKNCDYENFCRNLRLKLNKNKDYSSLIKLIIHYFEKVTRHIYLNDETFNERMHNILQLTINDKHYKLNDEDITNIICGISKFYVEEA